MIETDASCLGRFHYYQDETEQWKREKVPDFYLKSSRPHLLHFGGAFSHPWQGKDEDPINGKSLFSSHHDHKLIKNLQFNRLRRFQASTRTEEDS